ncbi:hypothetical protein MIMGU_mgv1a022160mg [Erythranthe guttata]|uniref:Uncharacterized protein n=1 Tax=Erythranthe guttata TaxID=4155 RepID=A0A022PXS9_ERYGU|nr:hypothetical protein MIMGU_mgv1a022160mg [Erythranthe guttata]
MAREKKMKMKKGWVAVQVGLANDQNQDQDQDQDQDYYFSSFRKFVIPISYLYNPLFERLLDRASEIYVYQTNGPLMLPCSVEDFIHLRWRIEARGSLHT